MLASLDIEKLLADLEADEVNNLVISDNLITKTLKGKTIKNIYIDSRENPETLTFETTEGELISFETEGDCCSHCWFADFFNIQALINEEVLGSYEIELEDYDYNTDDGRCTQSEDGIYGYKIYTKKGTAVLSFRDSSNGWYGGWINQTTDHSRYYSLKNMTNWMSEF